MTNLWYEITATVAPEDVEAVAAIMRAVVPGGVSIDEPMDLLGVDEGFRVRPGEPVSIRAYLPASELGAVLTDDLRTALRGFPGVDITARPLYEQDWSVSWREFFGVVETGGRVVIIPSWVEHEPEHGQVAIRLDPGQAFGTGHHESTRLCLGGLEAALRPDMTVLDVGTGSGILAIAAVLLGAGEVSAIDVDPVAVDVARGNAVENGVASTITFSAGVLDGEHAGRYDVVVANINRDANVGLAECFGRVTNAGGKLLLSGFLSTDVATVSAAMAQQGFHLYECRHERDWCMLGFTQTAGKP
jgi:ribosomal protein L11 methyltransferase